jgi:SAM-dependent methyltransferase
MKLIRASWGGILSPLYWLLAHRYPVPGLKFRRECARVAAQLFLGGKKGPLSYADIYTLLFWPMDSTRYFEFAFIWEALSDHPIRRLLDVSSPRLLPLMLVLKSHDLRAELINPDLADLTLTENFAKAFGIKERCGFHDYLINAVPFEPGSFDVVTSISVVEHIPEDKEAIRKMWEFVRPGGRLLLTVPCASETCDEYIDRNDYGLLEPNSDGFFFFQRLYDQRSLEERIFSIAGQPRRQVVYGEKLRGALRRTLVRKWGDPHYPSWREPYMMGKDFRYFKNLSELPGEGVIALEFKK